MTRKLFLPILLLTSISVCTTRICVASTKNSKKPVETRMDSMDLLVQYAVSLIGTNYKWGGERKEEGFDCSGFVIEILKAAGELPNDYDDTAQGLFNNFSSNGMQGVHGERLRGALAFFGKSATQITHVGFVINPYLMIEAGGGGPHVRNRQDAEKAKALIRPRPIKYRPDLVGIIRPHYTKIGRIW